MQMQSLAFSERCEGCAAEGERGNGMAGAREKEEEDAKSKMLPKTKDAARRGCGRDGGKEKEKGRGRITSRDNCAIRAINIYNVSIRRR